MFKETEIGSRGRKNTISRGGPRDSVRYGFGEIKRDAGDMVFDIGGILYEMFERSM